MLTWLRNHSLGLVLFALFFIFLAGQSLTGFYHYNEEQQQHNDPEVAFSEYITGGQFIEATFENWESEFLQMGAFVILTVFLRHKGSPESKKLKGMEEVDKRPKRSVGKDAPWPVRRGGWVLKLYEHSLSIAFLVLFLFSFSMHAWGGAIETCEENMVHNEPCVSTVEYATTSKFWFESFQNWQSEFLAVGSVVVLSVYLREKGSPESKPVNSPHSETGSA